MWCWVEFPALLSLDSDTVQNQDDQCSSQSHVFNTVTVQNGRCCGRMWKVKLSQEIEDGVKNADVCQEFGLTNSTMNMIWMNRTNY